MALKDKVLRRTLAILELPLAVVDTTLDHKIGAVGTAREFLADQVRRLDKKMGQGPDVEPVSHYEPAEPKKAAPKAEAKKAEPAPPKAEAKKAEPAPPKAEAKKPEPAAPKAEAKKAEPKAEPEAKAEAKAEPKAEAKAEAPAPKAEAKKPAPKKSAPRAPFADYDKLNVHKVSRHIRDGDEPLLSAVEAYEAANKDRKTIFAAIERRRERLAAGDE